MAYLGLDLSFSSTGFFLLKDDETNVNCEINTSKQAFPNNVKRSKAIADAIIDKIRDENIELVLMEDYFVGKFANSVIPLATLGTIVRDRLMANGYKYVTFAPTTIKKFESGNGASKKGNMVKNVFKNHQFDTSSDNIADACAMAYMCKGYCDYHKGNTGNFLKYQTEIFKKADKEGRFPELPYGD